MLVLACSPHVGGATDSLAGAVCRGAEDAGGHATLLALRDFTFAPCTGCQICSAGRPCPLAADGADQLFNLLARADCAVLVAPIYFYALPGQFKLFIDRSQKFWPGWQRDAIGKPAGVLLAAGRERGEKLFAGAILTLKYFLELLGYKIVAEVLLRGLDAGKPDLASAEALGAEMAILAQ